MEKTITMPLKEYQKIIRENEAFKKAAKDEGLILFNCYGYRKATGYDDGEWMIIKKDQLLNTLLEAINEKDKEIIRFSRMLYEMETEVKNMKKSFFSLPF